MNISPVITTIETSNLNKAIVLAAEYSGRTPELVCSTAGFYIAREVSRETHKATVGDIDSKLGVSSAPILSTRGRRKGLPLKSGAKKITSLGAGPVNNAGMLVVARMWAAGKYNISTNQRWALDRASFSPGEGVWGFWVKVAQHALAMVSSRHSSISFLASSAVPIIKYLEQRVAPKYRRGSGPTDPAAAGHIGKNGRPLGSAELTAGRDTAQLEGDFLVGMYPSLIAEQGNKAMWEYLAPILQTAINNESDKSLQYVAKEEMKAMSGQFASYGVKVI